MATRSGTTGTDSTGTGAGKTIKRTRPDTGDGAKWGTWTQRWKWLMANVGMSRAEAQANAGLDEYEKVGGEPINP